MVEPPPWFESKEPDDAPPQPKRYRIAAPHELPIQGARILHCQDVTIAVFRTHEGRIFALEDRCPHKGGPLSEGIVHGKCVTCPLHNWVISLDTGKVEAPDRGAVRTFPVLVSGDDVFIDLLSPPLGLGPPPESSSESTPS